ncbi:MAG TPA: MFS transporter [Baekduia sp.]|uniref:MFS transporter n=1 Tax=Baekduia sp. TaxID=2600305 RepID=UPI002D7A2DAF|nr:MFS transporter [Baekduia sp.]HET6510037.1 MFS transporter [Baekduia sp.]
MTSAKRTLFLPILALVLLADALDMIDATVTNIAAPTIVGDIGGGDALIKWLTSSYALSMGVLLVLGGRLGDRYGQRRLFLVGMAGFTVASALCGVASSPALVIVARAIQGAFGALLIPQGMAIMTKAFDREQLQTAFGLFGPLLGLSSVGGPLLAGFIIDHDLAGLSWRPIFLVNVVLGVVGLIAATRVLPHDEPDPEAKVDGVGAGLLAATMFGLIFGLIEGSTDGWTATAIASLVGGVAFGALFARRQTTAAAPLLKPSLLADRGFTSGLLTGLVFFAVTSGLVYIISLFMQQALGADPGDAALGLLPLTLGIIVSFALSMGAGLATKLGRTLIAVGMLVTLAGAGGLLAIVATQGLDTTLWTLAGPTFVTGLGMGLCFGTIADIALGDLAPEEAGGASGSFSAVQQLASGIGSAVVTSVYLANANLTTAMTTALVVVLGATALCLPVVRLLPRQAQPEEAVPAAA